MEFIDLKRQYQRMKVEIDRAVSSVLDSGRFILGEKVRELEERLAAFVEVPEAVGVSSGTDGLLLALMAYDVGPGDEVITTPFTFIATAEVIVLLGARPVFVDIDPRTYNLDPQAVAAAIGARKGRLKGIIAVSLFGQCADFDALGPLAEEAGIFLIEDACQSLGATYKGRPSGGLTELSVTSFFPAKPLGAYGDGGMIFCRRQDLAERLRALRVHGQRRRYQHAEIGLNARLDALQAAILLVKLAYFEEEILLRQKWARAYEERLADLDPIILPFVAPGNRSVFAQYSIRVPEREALVAYLRNRGIPTAIHYPVPLHLQPAFRDLGYQRGDFPVAEAVSREILSLPFHPYLTEEEVDQVAQAIRDFFALGA
ncbi:DegT/DnrJ/EryC1/StrS family aminotransferase [Thermosulfuriphilus sp.]